MPINISRMKHNENSILENTKRPDGKLKMYVDGVGYTFWHTGEFENFCVRDLTMKPDDIPLQDCCKDIKTIFPNLEDENLQTLHGKKFKQIKEQAGGKK
jgi:hypothetical protein